jgi:5-methylcytosine-specific restriction enzyme A
MSFDPGIPLGAAISNQELCQIFGCSPYGGMRRSKATNSLVVVSNRIESIYEDRWDGATLHYTGMGQKGDQDIAAAQNKTLAESHQNGIEAFLFEVLQPNAYTYRGRAALAGRPYRAMQPDVDGLARQVWIFPLQVLSEAAESSPDKASLDALFERKGRLARRLSDAEITARAEGAEGVPGQRSVATKQYERSAWVAEYAKRRARGVCELCGNPAPFSDRDGVPYLETHHVVWLARGGEDSTLNTVALCPNCHRKMHVVDGKEDRERLLALTQATRQ